MSRCGTCGKRVWFWQHHIYTRPLDYPPQQFRLFYGGACWQNADLSR